MGSKASRAQNGNGQNGNGQNGGTVGGWTEQDLSNPKIKADAHTLALITTDNIQNEPNFQFSFSNSTIDVTDLTTQVVNGTNYRVEYSIRDKEGDHVLYVTATLYRPPQAAIRNAEVVKKDYALENVNRSRTQLHDKNAQMAATPAIRGRSPRRRQGN